MIIDNINRYIPIIDTYSPNSINDISLIEDNWANFLNLMKDEKPIIFSNNITDTGIYLSKNKKNLLIIQSRIQHYRVPFFDSLKKT